MKTESSKHKGSGTTVNWWTAHSVSMCS